MLAALLVLGFLVLAAPDAAASSMDLDPVLRHPLPCRADYAAGSRIFILLGPDGFVTKTRFEGAAPWDSVEIAAVARRWIFRPYQLAGNSVWLVLPLRAHCPDAPAHRGVLPLPPRIMAPENALLARLRGARTATARRLLPPTEASLARVRTERGRTELFEGSWILDQVRVDADSVGATLATLLRDPRSRAGSPPWESRCLPEPDLAIVLSGPAAGDSTVVRIATHCAFATVRTPEATLFAPFGPVQDRFLALARRLFPGDRDFAPTGVGKP
jgi:hypothetical protein